MLTATVYTLMPRRSFCRPCGDIDGGRRPDQAAPRGHPLTAITRESRQARTKA